MDHSHAANGRFEQDNAGAPRFAGARHCTHNKNLRLSSDFPQNAGDNLAVRFSALA
ncbi:hypothetical protein BCEN4_1420004 [Burkholderia cenocepacia]|nr:hypothetical protein BCEN4_1420004 [Burkholderia cenocepacia]